MDIMRRGRNEKETNMNLPNKLTIFRMILIIPFVIIELTGCLGDYSGLTEIGRASCRERV